MSDLSHVDVESHLDEAEEAFSEQLAKAMIECSMQAVNFAKLACAVDTGRLRNSITGAAGAARGGVVQTPANQDKVVTDGKGITKQAVMASPEDYKVLADPEDGVMAIGTNVEYAPSIELGTSTQSPKGFLGIALSEHMDLYKKIIEKNLRGE